MSVNVTEVARMMRDQDGLGRDMSEAASLVLQTFTEKYVAPMATAVESQIQKAKENPCREAKLLSAMKLFAPPEKQEAIDRAIHMMQMADTAKSLRFALAPAYGAERPQAGSIHPDGVYDVDYACLMNKKKQEEQGLSPRLAMLMLLLSAQEEKGFARARRCPAEKEAERPEKRI